LKDEVGDVEVRGLWQVLGKDRGGRAGIVDDLLSGGGSRGTEGGDQEDLNDLEGKIGVLRKEFNTCQGRFSGKLGANCMGSANV
jgi:hypothetical protein